MNPKDEIITLMRAKNSMYHYIDFWGGDLLGIDDIERAKTPDDLKKILDDHSAHLEMQLSDALSHLNNFRKSLNLD